MGLPAEDQGSLYSREPSKQWIMLNIIPNNRCFLLTSFSRWENREEVDASRPYSSWKVGLRFQLQGPVHQGLQFQGRCRDQNSNPRRSVTIAPKLDRGGIRLRKGSHKAAVTHWKCHDVIPCFPDKQCSWGGFFILFSSSLRSEGSSVCKCSMGLCNPALITRAWWAVIPGSHSGPPQTPSLPREGSL